MASTNPVAPKTPDHESDGSVQSVANMTEFVQDLLVQMQNRFQTMSAGIVAKIDEMGSKIDQLEKNIIRFRAEMDAEATVISNTEEGKPSDESESS